MEIILRQENVSDYKAVFQLVRKAFEKEIHTDYKEQFLVEKLRKSEAFVPELSIVAEIENTIVGHILLTKIRINNGTTVFPSLALAPVSVQPEYQRKGIGGKLIVESHKIARKLGFHSVVLLGHENYYPKFGYELSKKYNIKLPFDVPDENCMVIRLTKKGLEGVTGIVEYPKEFYE